MSSDTPNGQTPNAYPVAFPRSVTKATPTPFAVYRNLELSDGTFIPVVRIDVLRADWSAVDEEGFCGDWESHLMGRRLTDEQMAEALDCVSEFVETLAAKLWAGETVPAHALASPAWQAKANSNLDPRLT